MARARWSTRARWMRTIVLASIVLACVSIASVWMRMRRRRRARRARARDAAARDGDARGTATRGRALGREILRRGSDDEYENDRGRFVERERRERLNVESVAPPTISPALATSADDSSGDEARRARRKAMEKRHAARLRSADIR